MKIQPDNFGRGPRGRKRSQDGLATVIFIGLLAIMMMLITAESNALFHLHREVKFLEQQQVKRLYLSQTNATSVVSLAETPEAK